MELVSERFIVSLLDRVVEVKSTHIYCCFQRYNLLKDILIDVGFCKTPIEGKELFLMTKLYCIMVPWPSG